MSLANCARCGKVFPLVSGGRDICQACIKEEEDNYRKVFQFLSTRPSATAQEIAQETEIDIKEIYRFARENRLRLVKTDTGFYCENCGIPISQGKICDKCRQKLSEEIKNDVDKFRQKSPPAGTSSVDRRDPKHLKDRRNRGKKA
jgi:flagellar operon protein (TIGR03826 family)